MLTVRPWHNHKFHATASFFMGEEPCRTHFVVAAKQQSLQTNKWTDRQMDSATA